MLEQVTMLKTLFIYLHYKLIIMKVKLLLCPLILILLFTSSFKRESKTTPGQSKVQNLNISFLLDLSDRIDPKKNFDIYQRDLQYIKSVEKAFINHIKKKKVLLLNDQMQVFFDPIPKMPGIDKLSQQLKVNFDKSVNRMNILDVEKNFSEIPSKIYQNAIKSGHYVGSDIWKFFKNNVENYCIKEKHRNILVILTDGYMYHKKSIFLNGGKSSYITPEFIKTKKLTSANYLATIKKNGLGFIPFEYNLKDLEIIVLGINPSEQNPYEEDVIKQYWSDWFKAMKVKKFELQTTGLPSDVEIVINNFIKEKP